MKKKSEYPFLSDQTIEKLIRDFSFENVLDIGCGFGKHSDILRNAGKQVTSIDYVPQYEHAIAADYLDHEFDQQFDCLWLSHVLEHQVNVNFFLTKLHRDLREGGVLAITVPPLKHKIVGGHVTLWNPGILLYNLILAGFDCSEASVRRYGYNISVITPKKTADLSQCKLKFANGDIEELARFFPQTDEIEWKQAFDGNFEAINWEFEPEPVSLGKRIKRIFRRAA